MLETRGRVDDVPDPSLVGADLSTHRPREVPPCARAGRTNICSPRALSKVITTVCEIDKPRPHHHACSGLPGRTLSGVADSLTAPRFPEVAQEADARSTWGARHSRRVCH
jgi:hypothetical protein